MKFWQWSRRILLHFVVLILFLLTAGVLYQYVSTKIDEKKYPPPGKMVDVGGYRLHLNCIGSVGPTVVLDAGLGCNSLDWTLIQPEISKFTRVCSFDRAGYPWSDKSFLKRTSQNMVIEMHTLLHNAKVPGPYILVGHSFGGVNALLYASTYPDDVAGIVLVDSSHEDQLEKFPSMLMPNTILIKFLVYTGIQRLMNLYLPQGRKSFSMFPKKIQDICLDQRSSNEYINTVIEEMSNLKESLGQLKKAGKFLENKPLIVIVAGKPEKEEGDSQKQNEEFFEIWKELQDDHVTKSTKGKLLIAKNSDHMVNRNQPSIVVEAVHEIVDNYKSKQSDSK
jgi:pimeloyl-ACP methyl ester carboxylesterase